jgi:hypothetical protein
MSASGASPCRHRGASTTVAGIDINDVIPNSAITEIDTEQPDSVITDVIVILDFQVEVIVAIEGILIRLRHGDLDRGRLTLTSITVPQRCAWAPGHVYARGGRRDIKHRPTQRRKESETAKETHGPCTQI